MGDMDIDLVAMVIGDGVSTVPRVPMYDTVSYAIQFNSIPSSVVV